MDVGVFFRVAVVALVHAGCMAEVGARAFGGEGFLALAREGGGVVAQVCHGVLADIILLGDDVGSCEQGGLLDVAVGDVALGVAR